MSETWQIKTLGEVCDVLDSKRKPITKKDRKSGEYPYYGATGIVDYVAEYIFDERLVLIGEDGAKWGSGDKTAFIADGKYWVNNHAHVLRPHDGVVLHEWIEYYFFIRDLSEYITGVTVPKLNQAKLRSIEIPVPTISEQKRIVKILDEKFEAIEKLKKVTEEQIKDAKELFESGLINYFTDGIASGRWSLDKIEDYCKVVVGYVGPISQDYTKDGSGVILLSTKNISNSGISLEKMTRVTERFHIKNKKSQLLPGDILVARHGNSGESAVIPVSIPEAHALNVIVIKKGEGLSSEYVSFLLNSGVLAVINNSKAGSVQQIINTSVIKNLTIPVPSEEEQNKIVEELNKLQEKAISLQDCYQNKLFELEELKKSYLEQAFAGKL